jgi:hypothetical protein
MVRDRVEALRGLRAVWVDAGRRDEFYLDLGADAFVGELRAIGIGDDVLHDERFDGGHGGIDWRYPDALAWLAERLAI